MLDINQACEAFRKILEEQQARIAGMDETKTDFATKQCVTIGVVDGDGIGPIITKQATRVLEKLLADEIAAGSIVIKYIDRTHTSTGKRLHTMPADAAHAEYSHMGLLQLMNGLIAQEQGGTGKFNHERRSFRHMPLA